MSDTDLTLRIIRAGIQLATDRMRKLPRPEPEVAPTAMQEALADEGLPKDADVEVDAVARLLFAFGDSVRAAERKGHRLVGFLGETLPDKKKPRRPKGD